MILICFNFLLLPSPELHRRVPLRPYLRHAWSWPDLRPAMVAGVLLIERPHVSTLVPKTHSNQLEP